MQCKLQDLDSLIEGDLRASHELQHPVPRGPAVRVRRLQRRDHAAQRELLLTAIQRFIIYQLFSQHNMLFMTMRPLRGLKLVEFYLVNSCVNDKINMNNSKSLV